MSLWRLEWLRLIRTHRFLLLAGLFVFFGILGPVTTRYLPEILERFGGGIEVSIPEPTPAQGASEFMSNALQLGLLAVAFVAAASLAFDANAEMSVFLRTRARVVSIVIPRFVVNAAASVIALLLGAAIAFYETGLLLGWPDAGRYLLGVGLVSLYLVFTVALTALIAGFLRSVPAVALVTVGVLILLGALTLVPALGRWLPSGLPGGFDTAVAGGDFTLWPAVVVTMAVSVLLIWAAILRLERREV
jgi:ABC-2 type transport system permease protein